MHGRWWIDPWGVRIELECSGPLYVDFLNFFLSRLIICYQHAQLTGTRFTASWHNDKVATADQAYSQFPSSFHMPSPFVHASYYFPSISISLVSPHSPVTSTSHPPVLRSFLICIYLNLFCQSMCYYFALHINPE